MKKTGTINEKESENVKNLIDFFNIENKNVHIKQTERNVIFTIGRALFINPELKQNLKLLKMIVMSQGTENSSKVINRVMADFKKIKETTNENVYESIIKENETQWHDGDMFQGVYGAAYAVDALNTFRENQERNK